MKDRLEDLIHDLKNLEEEVYSTECIDSELLDQKDDILFEIESLSKEIEKYRGNKDAK